MINGRKLSLQHNGAAAGLRDNGGRDGEIATMMRNKMNLVEGDGHHLDVWGYDVILNLAHSMGHAVLMALKYARHPVMDNMPYQGCRKAEAYVMGLHDMLENLYKNPPVAFNKASFVTVALTKAKGWYRAENTMLLKCFVLAEAMQVPFEDIFTPEGYQRIDVDSMFGYYDIRISIDETLEEARHLRQWRDGLTLRSGDGVFTISHVKEENNKIGADDGKPLPVEDYKKCRVEVPSHLAEKWQAVRFDVPSEDSLGAFYEAALPAMNVLKRRIQAYKKQHPDMGVPTHHVGPDKEYDAHEVAIYSGVTMKKLVDAIKREMRRKVVPDTSMECSLG